MIANHPEIPDLCPLLCAERPSRLHAVPAESGSGRSKGTGSSKRILVIDDEALIADSLTEILNQRGYQALAFYQGRAAINAVRKQCPDFVLSDVVMPELNGVETVLAIRRLCPRARILLFSGQATSTDVLEKARARGHDFELLPKPIHPDRLLKKLSVLGKPT